MENLEEMIKTILLSMGGAGVVIVGLSSYLGKIWANRLMDKERAALAKDLELYKQELNIELQKFRNRSDKASYVSKALYDKEFEIYLTMWDHLVELSYKTYELFVLFDRVPADEQKQNEYKVQKYTDYALVYNQFVTYLKKHGPFFNAEIEKQFVEYRELCHYQGNIYATYVAEPIVDMGKNLVHEIEKEESLKVKRENPKLMQQLESTIKTSISNHLKSLEVIE